VTNGDWANASLLPQALGSGQPPKSQRELPFQS
jgi:hypothetical protein